MWGVMWEWLQEIGTVATLPLAFFMWRVYSNHLPSIEKRLNEVIGDTKYLRGRIDGED